MQNTRALAAKILGAVFTDKSSLSAHLPITDHQLDPKDRAFIQELCFGVCRWYFRLDLISQKLLNKPFKSKDRDVLALLLIGLYQLIYMRIPAHAAINESVAACTDINKLWSKGLINAVLRRFLREQPAIEASLQNSPVYKYAHPEWLLNRLQVSWPEDWVAICRANNVRAPLTLRVNQQQLTRDDYLSLLEQANITASPCQWAHNGVVLHNPCNVELLPGFKDGAVSVQDEAAQLAADLLLLKPDMRVLDSCAAPGGKTCHIVEAEPALELVIALDNDAQRADRLHQNLTRLGVSNKVHVLIGDAATPENWWDAQLFDRILLDAPCSATGVIRRHPDIKLLRRDQDIDKLAVEQLNLLAAMWPLLKPGGLLLYATCSILVEENEQVINRFLNSHADAQHDLIAADWGVPQAVGRHILPSDKGSDGFYYARLIKSTC